MHILWMEVFVVARIFQCLIHFGVDMVRYVELAHVDREKPGYFIAHFQHGTENAYIVQCESCSYYDLSLPKLAISCRISLAKRFHCRCHIDSKGNFKF